MGTGEDENSQVAFPLKNSRLFPIGDESEDLPRKDGSKPLLLRNPKEGRKEGMASHCSSKLPKINYDNKITDTT